MFLRKWNGLTPLSHLMCSPISAVIWVTDDLLSDTIKQIKEAKFPSRLVIHIVLAFGKDYPINYLRNLGIPKIEPFYNSDRWSRHKSLFHCRYGCLARRYILFQWIDFL